MEKLAQHKWNPEDYEKNSSAQEKWADTLISGLKLKGNEHILDIGCGDGKITAKMAARVPEGQVLGIDSSQDMIDFARKRFPPSQYANLRFELGDALGLDFDQEFDLATSFACLHWIRDHLTVLKGVRRSLRPGGRLLFQCGGRGNAGELMALTEDLIRESRWSRYFQGFRFPYYFYGTEGYHDWLEQAGLEEIRVELIPKEMVQHGAAGLVGWIRATWHPVIERIPEDMKTQFVSEMAERYLERHPLEDGLAKVGMMRLEVEAGRPD
ncbi:MAG TPA: methyltransferase domain-containing protein [Methanotrichaceae archaeon]|nr:methyltransferase domain-containing protein [Methanotrichaceae archaeon]